MLSFKPFLIFIISLLFLVAGIVSHNYFKNQFDEKGLAIEINNGLHRTLANLEIEANEILKKPQTINWASIEGSYFLWNKDKIVNWSKNTFVPDAGLVKENFESKYLKNQRGDFIIRKWSIDSNRFLIGVLPLVEQFKVVNKYLHPQWNESIFPVSGIQIMDVSGVRGTPVCDKNKKCLFKIALSDQIEKYPTDRLSIFLICIGLVLLCISLVLLLVRIHQRQNYDIVFLLGLLSLAIIRVAMVLFKFPQQWGSLDRFDPQVFASSSFNVSLGDFMLNALVIGGACAYAFVFYSRFKVFKILINASEGLKIMAGILLMAAAFFSFLYPFLFFEIIFHNSSIVVDITQQLSFDLNRFWAYFAIIIGTISSFFFCHVFIRIVSDLLKKSRIQFAIVLLGSVTVFLIYCWIDNHNYLITIVVGSIYFSILYLGLLSKAFSKIGFSTFLYLLVAVAAYAVQGALSVKNFSKEATIAAQFRFGNNNLVNHDILGEYLLSENLKKIAADTYIQSRLANPLLPKGVIRQRIAQVYLSSYFDRYTSKIYLFGPTGEPITNQTSDGLANSIRSLQEGSVKTDYDGVYWISTHGGESIRKYIGIVQIARGNSTVGFVVLELSLKHIVPQSVYPELLLDNRFYKFASGQDFSYVFFRNGILVSSFGNFNYQKNFDRKLLSDGSIYKKGILSNQIIHCAIEGDFGEIAVISSNDYPLFYTLANFAFQFILGLGVIFLWLLGYSLIGLTRNFKINYSARIQLYIYLAVSLPLVVISIVTLNLINKSNEDATEKNLRSRAQQLVLSITDYLEVNWDSLNSEVTLEQQLSDLSKSSSLDINVYSPQGYLMASSQPEIFSNQLTSNLISTLAYDRLVKDKEAYFVNREKIGSLVFNNSYLAVDNSRTGKLMAILSLPFIKSDEQTNKDHAIVFSNILVVFVGVFLLFTLLSYYAVRWLTFPLQFITKTLRNTTLGKNATLKWKSDDEIGLMVSEYNRMVENLETSRIQLARTQKESAWREMAQQVAHEIKNPLTPMKLILQQMELAFREDVDRQKSIQTLLNQVEILNQIASSFSTFAKMPSPNLERHDVVSILKETIALYSTQSAGSVYLKTDEQSVFVMCDDQLFSRIFSNLILNGLQAATDGRKISVTVSLSSSDTKCVILFQDDGMGIPSEVTGQIFVPYFSTKKSGSGLGLAIAKQGIEQCGGSISFTTEIEKGTIFKIELPTS